MNKNDFEQYLKDRYYNQIKWYDKKAIYNKNVYKGLQTVVAVLSVVTLILLLAEEEWLRWLAIISSTIVAIGTTLLSTFKYQEKWINYRTICETLRKEKHYYDAKLYDYRDAEDPEALFVRKAEDLISRDARKVSENSQ
jgi:hypothetical protein